MKTVTFDPKKWKLVPIEATPEMLAAMRKVKRDRMIRPIKERAKGTPLKSMEPQCVEEWRAALATAPEHPTGRAGQ